MIQSSEKEYDVCICGGGIAGLVTAYALGKKGRKVLIVEKNSNFNPNGADVLKPSGIEVMEKLGLFDQLLNYGAIKRDNVLIYYAGELVSKMDYRLEHKRKYFMLMPYRNVLTLMLDMIKEVKDVEFLFNTELTSASVDETTGVITSVMLNEKTAIRAKVFIAADGLMSRLRSIVNVPNNITKYTQQMYFAQFPMVETVESHNRLYVDKNHSLAYFYPVGKDQFRSVIGLSKDEGDYYFKDKKSSLALRRRLSGFVTQSDDALEAITTLDNFVTFPLCKMNLDSYYKGNVVFIGNAAHSIHPVTGQGMNLAIEDAGGLYPLLENYFLGSVTLEETFENYQQLRHDVNSMMVNYGDNLVASFDEKETFLSKLNLNLQTSNRRLQETLQGV